MGASAHAQHATPLHRPVVYYRIPPRPLSSFTAHFLRTDQRIVSPDLQREMATSAKIAPPKPATSTSTATAVSKTAVKARGAFTRGQTIVGLQVQTAESKRLAQDKTREANWKRWGPYLSERQWATVREDYSPTGSW